MRDVLYLNFSRSFLIKFIYYPPSNIPHIYDIIVMVIYVEVYIEKYDDLGNGLAHINNKICFIKKAIPNELVNIKLIKDNKKYSLGVITNIIKKSENRVEPICKYYNECGGCNFLHIKKEEQIKFK